jgi:hypothetical protein
MSTTPEPASGRKAPWRRVGNVVRRSLSRSSSRAPSPSRPEHERDSDVASIKGTSKPSSLRLVDTAMLSPPGESGAYSVPSPIAESPAREAASSDMFSAFSEKMFDPAIANGSAFTPAPPADAEHQVLTSASEMTTVPDAPSQPAITYTTNPSTEVGGSTDTPLIHVQDVLADSAWAVIASREDSPAPYSGAPIPEAAPPAVRDSVENSVSEMNTKDEVSTKPSNRPLGNGL